MTDYIILRKDPEKGIENGYVPWQEFGGTVRASSARRALAADNLDAGVYVAVPARSWKPLTVKVEQTTKVTIG